MKIGGMCKVNPELMSFIVYVLSKDTPAEGELLSVMILPVIYDTSHAAGQVQG